jgi:hypothetical protein
LFWIVISKLEESAFDGEITQMTTDGVNNILNNLDSNQQQQVKNYINTNLTTIKAIRDISNTENELKKLNNEWLMTCNMMFAGFLFVLLITMILCLKNVPVKFLLKENLAVFFFIGIIELAFFMLIAKQFSPLKPSSTVLGIYARVKNNIVGE